MAATPSAADRLMDSTLGLVAARGWMSLTMTNIARQAGISLAETLDHFRSKGDLLTALLTRVDRRVLEGSEASVDEPVRDRLFDVLMRRFDVLQPHKAAITAMLRALPRDPSLVLPAIPRFAQSMLWMLEAAGVSTAGPAGFLRAQGLAVIYLHSLRVWINDDSQDLSRTMAALDKALTQADTLVRRLPMLGWSEASPQAPVAGAEADETTARA